MIIIKIKIYFIIFSTTFFSNFSHAYWWYAPFTKIMITIPKKLLFAQNIQIFGLTLHIFVSSDLSCTIEKVSHWHPDIRRPKVLFHPPEKKDFWPRNGQIWHKNANFCKISAFLSHLIKKNGKIWPKNDIFDQKTMWTRCLGCYCITWVTKILLFFQ